MFLEKSVPLKILFFLRWRGVEKTYPNRNWQPLFLFYTYILSTLNFLLFLQLFFISVQNNLKQNFSIGIIHFNCKFTFIENLWRKKNYLNCNVWNEMLFFLRILKNSRSRNIVYIIKSRGCQEILKIYVVQN